MTQATPSKVVQWNVSLKTITDKIATAATAPVVKTGWAILSGNTASEAAYNTNAPPYNVKPNQKGQLLNDARGSLREGNLRGGIMAIFIKTLAEALHAMPRISINHFKVKVPA